MKTYQHQITGEIYEAVLPVTLFSKQTQSEWIEVNPEEKKVLKLKDNPHLKIKTTNYLKIK